MNRVVHFEIAAHKVERAKKGPVVGVIKPFVL
jgi:hypothetical protein